MANVLNCPAAGGARRPGQRAGQARAQLQGVPAGPAGGPGPGPGPASRSRFKFPVSSGAPRLPQPGPWVHLQALVAIAGLGLRMPAISTFEGVWDCSVVEQPGIYVPFTSTSDATLQRHCRRRLVIFKFIYYICIAGPKLATPPTGRPGVPAHLGGGL